MIQSLRNEFGLTGSVETMKIECNNAEAGIVYVNTVQADFSKGAWEGQYFTDYPVTVTAVANPGYEFVGWIGNIETEENCITMNLTEGENAYTAVFKEVK